MEEHGVYNRDLAGFETKIDTPTPNGLSKSFNYIQNVPITDIQQQAQVYARASRTGLTRGDQQIKGQTQVVDKNGTVQVIMGYGKGQF